MTNTRLFAALLLIATLSFAGGPFVTSFSGFDPNAYPVPQDNPPAQPAGYAFSIWGVIYLWLIVMAGYGVWTRAEDADWASTRVPLLVSIGVGVIWLPVAEVSPVWATVLIWVMLVSAVVALLRTPERDRWLLRAPVGLYAGWLTAASWVSMALTGAGYDLLRLGQTVWAVVAVLGALAMAAAIITTRGPMAAYAAAVIWALVGLIAQNAGGAVSIAVIAGVGAALLAALAWRAERLG